MRVRHKGTGAEGTATLLARALNPFDNDGPWCRVQFDDGLNCAVPTSRLWLWSGIGWV